MSTQAQAPTRYAALSLLIKQGESKASNLANALGISVQAMRKHLRSLEEEGLVEANPSGGRPGRPSNSWRLTRLGTKQFHDGSEDFALGLLDSMITTLPPETVTALLKQQAIEKAVTYKQQIGEGSIKQRVENLAKLRRSEGYVSESFESDDGVSFCLNEFHCSVQRIAEEFPSVCDQELLLIRRTFPDCEVERVHWRLEGGHSCGFQISPCTRNG